MIPKIVWAPQHGPQAHLVSCPLFEIFFGGARGGGKTDAMLGKFAIKADRYGKHVTGVFFRRTREDLAEALERSFEIYQPLGAVYHVKGNYWRFPNNARLKFTYLDNDKDAQNYQGHSYTDLFFEEITNWATPTGINKLKATLRSPHGIPCQFHATGNPGGPGHAWVKARYIDPAPSGYKILTEQFENPFTKEILELDRVFIPSRLPDNKILIAKDPLYIAKLQQSGSKQLVDAWLSGNWNIVDGAFFDCWSNDKHVIKPFAIPQNWQRFRSFDWGSAKPFSAGWWAVCDNDYNHNGIVIPRGAMVRYREWYGAKKDGNGETIPNVGLKMTADEVSRGIIDREDKCEVIKDSIADPAIFSEDGGPSIAERMKPIYFRRADNSRQPGWDQMRYRLNGEDGRPMIYCFDTCIDSIRTIPVIQHDTRKPEDLDSSAEDHALDDWRYACMSRPWAPAIKIEGKKLDRYEREKVKKSSWKIS